MSAVDIVFDGGDATWTVARVAQRGSETFVEYTDDHLARAVELASVRHLTEERHRHFIGREPAHLPGLLADAMPDSWGRLVLRRDMRRHGIEQPTPLQMLTWLGPRTMGALTFHPADGPTGADRTLVDLDRLQGEMLRQLAGDEPRDESADALARAAGSGPGGARPKIAVVRTPDGVWAADDGDVPSGCEPWLVKFHSTDDNPYLSAIEATYLEMAAAMGIAVCEHELLAGSSGTRYLAVRRFDRIARPDRSPARLHMASAAGLLEAYPELDQHLGYVDLIRLTRVVTGDVRDVEQVVRRAVFNVVSHNRDDHARNTSYLWTDDDGWRLAPAYDLTHSMGPRPAHLAAGPGEHYLDVTGKGRDITRADLRGLSSAAGLRPSTIDDIVDAALAMVNDWPSRASANGVDGGTIEEVAARLPALAQN